MRSDPPLSPLDPALLAAFRQQGAAIVARERGLTPACLVKLSGLARSLGIAEDQIDAALRALSPAEPAAPPNPQAEKLRARLRKDLAGKTRTIVGPTIEAQIIAAANRKYGLDEATTRQVLGEVAAELGLSRITASDATRSLAAQIDQTVGESTWLAREVWDRLRSAGNKWGLELEVIDELIDERLAANRSEARRRGFWSRLTLQGAGGAAILVGAVIAVLIIARLIGDRATGPPTGGAHPAATTSPRAKSSGGASWHDVDLAVDLANLKSRLSGTAALYDLLRSADADQRAAGYEKLLEHVRAAPSTTGLLAAVGRVLAGCYALEPDDAAASRLRTGLIALLPSPDAPLWEQPEQLDLAYWAADTAAAAMARRGAHPGRTQSLAAALTASLGTTPEAAITPENRLRALRAGVTKAAYQQLTAAAAKNPELAAAHYGLLAERAAGHLTEEDQMQAESSLLAAALPAAGPHWRAYEAAMARCAAASDPLPPLRLLETFRRVTDEELARELAERLVDRAGVRPTSWSRADVAAAVRRGLGGSSLAVTAAQRWLSLQEQAGPALARAAAPTSDTPALLDQTVELAHLTTLAIALAQGEAGYASFDALFSQPPAQGGSDSPEGASGRAANRAFRPPNPRQQRELTQFVETLGNPAAGQIRRESALRGVAALAAEIADLPPRQAEQVANYLLSEKSPEEQANVLKVAAELRRYQRLRLAVADGLANSKLPAEQQAELTQALAGRALPAGAATPDRFRVLFLASVLDELGDKGAALAAPDSAGQALDNAAGVLVETFRERARLLGVSTDAIAAAQSPAQALELSLLPLAAAVRGSEGETLRAELPHRLLAARYLAGDDLRQTVAIGPLLIELSAQQVAALRPQHAAAARQIESELLAATAAADNILVQLRDCEAAFLKLWLLYAPDA